jgi:formate hydrogenlyase subunit 6/NADH:ubiquinone oxidoreductase subunit I
MWMTLKTALRTVPFVGKARFLKNDYHGQPTVMIDQTTMERVGPEHPSAGQKFAADRETSQVMPFVERPVTVMYPYERLEDLEPWLFVPGNYFGRIGIVWETCTSCKLCIRACPNDCLHMTTELRVDVLDLPDEDDEWHGYGSELEEGGYAAREKEEYDEIAVGFDLINAHADAPQQYDFAEVIEISGDKATVRWSDGSGIETVDSSSLKRAEQDIVSGQIDLGRCMFCGLCAEACPFESFFMTNEYDGMSGFSREELWMDASRTRLLPAVHQERVDMELAKRAEREEKKRSRKAARAEA